MSTDLFALLREADAQVKASTLFDKFIDGTPLENDIAVWMGEFAKKHLDVELAALRADRERLREFNVALTVRLETSNRLLKKMLDVAEIADETGYVEDCGFVDLDKLHAEVRAAIDAARESKP